MLYAQVHLTLPAWVHEAVDIGRVYAGGAMSQENQEASMLMNLPLWIPYMLMVPGLVLCTLVGLYQAYIYWTQPADEQVSVS